MWDGLLGTVRTVKCRIHFEPVYDRPIRSFPYRPGPEAREIEKEEINELVSMNFAEPVQSEWASPTVFAPKKDGSLRFCVD